MIFPDVSPRSAGNIEITAPQSWIGNMTALHILTSDYSQRLGNNPKTIIKFKAGADASSIIH